jgi:hypothetical protein
MPIIAGGMLDAHNILKRLGRADMLIFNYFPMPSTWVKEFRARK